jgi:predicted AAA+ superfamily ATPase
LYPVHGYNRLGCSTATNPPAGQILNISKAGQAVGLESSTANRYATLLEEAFMIQRLPAWGTTLGNRIAAYPKVHVIDSGLAGWLLGLSAAKISSRDPLC